MVKGEGRLWLGEVKIFTSERTGDGKVAINRVIKRTDNPTSMCVLLSLYTGLRVGEVCGLMWEDIDFEYYGFKQGFAKNLKGQFQFNPAKMLPEEILPYMPIGLTSRQFPNSSERVGGERTWDDLFLQERKIIVINLGTEVGDSTHQLLDMMIGSLFNWQMSHDTGFLSIAIDELIDQDFSTGAPLQTLVKQGRKFHAALLGATQDYYNQGSSYLDVMKQANMKSFCRPGKSEDHVARKLGFRDAIDAGFYKFNAGDEILEFDGYNKETGENEALTIKGRVVNFIETPLYEKFKEIYGC